MHLSPGTRFGPYEIVGLVGAGGMGEVYRARDTRLKRDVAVKILPDSFCSDPSRLARFQVEAQSASALNHPNILTVYDIGTNGQAPYLVAEMLEGESLTARLRSGKLSVARAIDFARQIASGLAAAHAKGIIHRDIKPDNLFITKDGRIKILDFGLARITVPPVDAHGSTRTAVTEEGTITGTVPYMSPEQVRGKAVDRRSDIFSFGCVLYEILSGQQPFRKDTPSDTMAAILKDEAPDLSTMHGALPPALERIVQHCLEKDPDARFQSAQDVAFALETLSQSSRAAGTPAKALAEGGRQAWLKWVAAGTLVCGLLAGTLIGYRLSKQPERVFHRLTFRRGRLQAARFTPDGNGVVYSAQWESDPSELYPARFDSPGSRALSSPGAELLAISSSGELATKENPQTVSSSFFLPGVLARVPLSGGAPRALENRITFADWSPDGREMAVVRETDQGQQIEYPIGTALYRTSGALSVPRVSPTGDQIAFIEHRIASDDGGTVGIVDRRGHKKTLTDYYESTSGLAWPPNGNEIWFSAAKNGARCDLLAVTLTGRERTVYSGSTRLALHDIARDGRVLASNEDDRATLWFRGPTDARTRELSWLDWSVLSDISPDGKLVAFSESGEGAGGGPVSYLRDTSGAPAVAWGQGLYPTFAPDGQSVVVVQPSSVTIYPVGPGESKQVAIPGFTIRIAGLLPDGKRIWFLGTERSQAMRFYLADIDAAKPHPITPAGLQHVSPSVLFNGKYLAGRSQLGLRLFPVEGGEQIVIPVNAKESVNIAGASNDGHTLFLATERIPSQIYRFDVKTGRKELMMELAPVDRAGVIGGMTVQITPDGKSYAYSYPQELSELHWVEGLK
ncbi:MAG: protein kinase domain-containing protein [Bryobacteraceae bacterium]